MAQSRLRTAFATTVLATVPGCGGSGGFPLASVAPPTIRVELGSARESAALVIAGAWDCRAEAGHAYQSAGTDLVAQVDATDQGIAVRGTPTGATVLRFRSANPFHLSVGDERVAYRGDLLVRQEGARLRFVDEVDLESYVAGVIVNEIGIGQSPAAYRAQSVVARSYGYVKWRASPDAPTHVFDDTRSQVYRGLNVPANAGVTVAELDRFTAETRGVILTWRSEPFPTYYCSTCGGHTTDAATANLDSGGATEPLRGVPCRWCSSSKYFSWTEEVPIDRIVAGLKSRGVSLPVSEISWSKVGPGGWVGEATLVCGPRGIKKVVPGSEFRSAARLRSMRIESVTPTATGILVKGSGWGHGVGLCQVGAQEMARRGFDEAQILRWYYPGADFTRLY